jgi:hypothetical protein
LPENREDHDAMPLAASRIKRPTLFLLEATCKSMLKLALAVGRLDTVVEINCGRHHAAAGGFAK